MNARVTFVKTVLFLLMVAAVPLFLLREGGFPLASVLAGGMGGEALSALEGSLRDALPLSRELEQAGVELQLIGGLRERDGVFIGDNALIRNIAPPNEALVEENSAAIMDFARLLRDVSNRKRQTYLAVIPTSGAILTERLPRFAVSRMVNQRRVIEDLYSQVSPAVRTMDVYSTLDGHDGEYIYYRTEDNLTSLGGYYVYYAMGRRLGLNNRGLNRYEALYADHDYYGSLYPAPRRRSFAESPGRTALAAYGSVEPDLLALYRYSYSPREYTVTHIDGGEERTYHSLYPGSAAILGAPTDVYLGGSSPRLELVTSSDTSSVNKTRLLVFGDKTAAAYLPFLLNHYQQVTFCDLSLMDAGEIRALRPDQYGEVIFAYSVESYIQSADHIARVAAIDWDGIYSALEG